jgi:hypothetical protein
VLYEVSPQQQVIEVGRIGICQYYTSLVGGFVGGLIGCFSGAVVAVACLPVAFLANSCRQYNSAGSQAQSTSQINGERIV